MSYPPGPPQPPSQGQWPPPGPGQWPPPTPLQAQPPVQPQAQSQPPQWQQPGQRQWESRMVAHPHSEPRSYPLMLRTWDYSWWRPVVGFLLLLVGGFFVVPLVLLPVLAVAVALEGGAGSFTDEFVEALTLDSVTPASMLYLNLTLAALTLVTMGIVRWIHRLRPRWLSSVMPGMRWRFFFACLGLSVVALVASVLISALLPQDPNELGGEPNKLTGTLIATGIVILLTTPLQALGEEYAFRGYLMQAFGSFTHAIAESSGVSAKVARGIAIGVALVLTSGLFALAHGAQNFPLFFDRFAFGLMAGLVVVLVGGLEAGIALHILNNLVAFAIAITFGDLQGALTVSEVSWWQLPVTVVQNGIYLVLVLLVARRMGLRNKTAPPVPQAAPQHVG